MININPLKFFGNWFEGHALDLHTISSTFLGYDGFGHKVFENKYSDLGSLLYKLKYKQDQNVLIDIVEVAIHFINNRWKDIIMKVFIGGSRKISRLNKEIKIRIDNLIKSNSIILIGDANGVDKSIQAYLQLKNYPNVYIYCVNNTCRNNLGDWEVRNIRYDSFKKDYKYYSSKDIKMANETDFGFMIWDGESKGTLNNMINLIRQNKKVLLYFSPKKAFYNISNFTDLNSVCPKFHNQNSEIVPNLFSELQ